MVGDTRKNNDPAHDLFKAIVALARSAGQFHERSRRDEPCALFVVQRVLGARCSPPSSAIDNRFIRGGLTIKRSRGNDFREGVGCVIVET
jgi:hypothetical protein